MITFANLTKRLQNINNNDLFGKCIDTVIKNVYKNNQKQLYVASEIQLKDIKQDDIYDMNSINYSLCMTASIITSFSYIKLDVNDIVTNCSKSNRLDILIKYINKHYCNKLSVKLEADNFNLENLQRKINSCIQNNVSPVFCFKNYLKESFAHATSVYKFENNWMGYIENAREHILLYSLGLFDMCMSLFKTNPDILKTTDIDTLFSKNKKQIEKWFRHNDYIKILSNNRVEINLEILPICDLYYLIYPIMNFSNNLSIYDRLSQSNLSYVSSKYIEFN